MRVDHGTSVIHNRFDHGAGINGEPAPRRIKFLAPDGIRQEFSSQMAALVPDLPKVEQHIVEMTNQVRAGQKLSPVKVDAMLAKAARAYAQSLARSGAFSHNADGLSPQQRAEIAGYKYCAIAENLAMDRNGLGFSTGDLAIQVMAGWMNSAPHRTNITMPSVIDIGVGVARAPGPVAKFISVELFGRPASAAYGFQIVNMSNAEISYTIGRKAHGLKPNASVVHSGCVSSDLVFSKSGSFLSPAFEIARVSAEDNKLYMLKSSASGALTLEITTGPKRR
jgi:uncharacterized protein YkwD